LKLTSYLTDKPIFALSAGLGKDFFKVFQGFFNIPKFSAGV